jgi:hypothetical protein
MDFLKKEIFIIDNYTVTNSTRFTEKLIVVQVVDKREDSLSCPKEPATGLHSALADSVPHSLPPFLQLFLIEQQTSIILNPHAILLGRSNQEVLNMRGIWQGVK